MIGNEPPEKRYELVERIAVGGMAEVFRAKAYGPHGFEKVLAIKRVLPGLVADPKFERRFIAEAKLAASLTHANIVQVVDFSRFGQSLYIVMEYVDGGDVASLLDRTRERAMQMPLAAAIHVAAELLKGLDFAHRRGVVHRDVSPSNILLSRAGEVKIGDFGIAQAVGFEMTRSLRIMGKWRYMSPEQTRGQDLDARSDVFSAGAVIHEILTGERLFPGNDAEEIVRNLRAMPLPRPSEVRPDLPPELDAPLAAALERDRDKRTTSAAQLHAMLMEVCYARSLPALPTALARFLDQVGPPGGEKGASADAGSGSGSGPGGGLLDEIIHSELDVAGGGRTGKGKSSRGTGRHTAMALGPPPVAPEDLPSEVVEAPPSEAVEASPSEAVEAPPLSSDVGSDATLPGGAFIRSITDASGARRWELVDEDDEDDGDVTRAVESEAPDTPVPMLRDADEQQDSTRPGSPMPGLQTGADPRGETLLSMAPPPAMGMPPAMAPPPSSPLTSLSPSSPSSLHPVDASSAPRPPVDRTPSHAPPDTRIALLRRSRQRFIAAAIAVVAGGVVIGVVAGRSGSGAPRGGGGPLSAEAEPVERAASPAGRPASDPAGRPASDPVARPASDPAGRPASDPAADRGGARSPAPVIPAAPETARPAAPDASPRASTRSAEPAPPSATSRPVEPASAPGDRDQRRSAERRARRDRHATVDIYSEPWANIYLGKRKVGVAPQRGVRLPVGRHRLRLVNPVLKRSTWVTVTVPSSRPVRVTLPER